MNDFIQNKYGDITKMVKYPSAGLDCLDAQENQYLLRELEHIIPDVVETIYSKQNARTVFPIDSSADPTSKIITWRQATRVGQAKIVTNYADDVPLVDSFMEETSGNVRTIAIAAQWSVDDIQASMKVGRPLDRSGAISANEFIQRTDNTIAFNGDVTHGLTGLFSAGTGIPVNAVVGADWATKAAADPTLMVNDMNTCVNTIVETTGDMEKPNTLLLPTPQYHLAINTRMADGTDTTVMNYFINNSPYINSINDVIPVRELTTPGAAIPGGVPTMVAYDKNINNIRMNVVMEVVSLAPQDKNMVILVIYRYKTGGVTVRRPLTLHFCYGI